MDNLLIALDGKSKKHLYEQIYDFIRKEIREGKLRFGERLPSTRLLAQQLQISRSTVELAYEQLSSEGYIQPRPCRGYFICDVSQHQDFSAPFAEKKPDGAEKHPFEERMEHPETETRSGADPSAALPYDFSPNAIDMTLFPVETWKRIHKRVLLDYQDNLLRLGDARGDLQLRETICHYLHASRGMNCNPDQIVIGAGNDYLLLLLQKILGPGRTVAMEQYTYMRAYRIFKSGGYRMRKIGMDESGMKAEELASSDADIAYVMPSHQFPCGVTMPIRRRMELLAWAQGREDRYLIEDDYDSEFRYRGKPVPALQSLDGSGRVICIGTFSKSLTPAIRISYLVLPRQLLPLYEKNAGFLSSTVSRIDQAVLNTFIAEGYFERHLNKSRKIYRQKHDVLMEAIQPLKEIFDICGDEAGLHIILRLKKEKAAKLFSGSDALCESEMLRSAYESGCKVYGMRAYEMPDEWEEWQDKQEENSRDSHTKSKKEPRMPEFLLGYASMRPDQIEEGASRLSNVWLPSASSSRSAK